MAIPTAPVQLDCKLSFIYTSPVLIHVLPLLRSSMKLNVCIVAIFRTEANWRETLDRLQGIPEFSIIMIPSWSIRIPA